MNKKYKTTNETKQITFNSDLKSIPITLNRIQALRSFDDVKKGELGGWIDSTSILEDEGNCWIADEACVFGASLIKDNAKIIDAAKVFGSLIKENASVEESANVYNAFAFGNCRIYGHSQVKNGATIYGKAEIFDDAIIENSGTHVCGNAKIFEEVYMMGGYAEKCANIYGQFIIKHGYITEDIFNDILTPTLGILPVNGIYTAIVNETEFTKDTNNIFHNAEINSFSSIEHKAQLKSKRQHLVWVEFNDDAELCGNEHRIYVRKCKYIGDVVVNKPLTSIANQFFV